MLFGAGLLATMLALAASTPVAHAGACGTFTASNSADHILLGEQTNYFWYDGQYWFYRLGKLAICWGSTTPTTSELFTGCDTSSTSSDYIQVNALAGNDILMPNEEAHLCDPLDLSGYLETFDEARFDFYVRAEMGTGADVAHGTENGDKLYSNVYGSFGTLPYDSAEDTLCGWGGNDLLYGDGDDSNTFEEILEGGNGGSDYCYGGHDGDYYDWAHTTCESPADKNASSYSTAVCTSKPDLWW